MAVTYVDTNSIPFCHSRYLSISHTFTI